MQPARLPLQSGDVKILVIGSGGREHALAWRLSQSPDAEKIVCAPGNAGTEEIGENVAIGVNEFEKLAQFAQQNRVELTVVGPDDPLAGGIVDFFQERNLRIFGPRKTAAQLEASKIFAKELMRANNIPTAKARTFFSVAEALRACQEMPPPLVVNADGLALGKVVVIANDRETA